MLFLKNICKIYLGQAVPSTSKAVDAVSYSTGIAIRHGIQIGLAGSCYIAYGTEVLIKKEALFFCCIQKDTEMSARKMCRKMPL